MPPPLPLHKISLILCTIRIVLKVCEYEWVRVRQKKVWIREFLFKNHDDNNDNDDGDDDDDGDETTYNITTTMKSGAVVVVWNRLRVFRIYELCQIRVNVLIKSRRWNTNRKEVEYCKNENNLIFLSQDY